MCRPLKNGLEYFPLDTDVLENRKVQRLLRKYGCEGFAVYSAVLCDIYRHEGYYVRYDDAYCRDIAFVLNLPEENPGLVGEVIGYCISLELFDAELAERENILTSVGIQMRYREVRKRYKVSMRNEFLLPSGTEAPAALPGKPVDTGVREEKKKKAPLRSAGRRSGSAPEFSRGVTESGAGNPVTGTSETTNTPLYIAQSGLVPQQGYRQTKTEGAVPGTGRGETGERLAGAGSAGMPAGATGSGAYGGVTGVSAAEPTVGVAPVPVDTAERGGCVSEVPAYATEASVVLTESPADVTETLLGVTEPPVHVTETRIHVTETPLCVAETRVHATETPVCVTETPTKEKENKKERKEKIEERIAGYYNFRLSGKLPPVVKLTHGRIRAVLARGAEYGEAGVMGMLDAAAASPFLLGENHRRWRADFDWLFKPANFVKVWEGNYVNSHGNETHSGSNRLADERKRAILRMAAEAASRDCTA